jgi:cytoskeletal protein RodZ
MPQQGSRLDWRHLQNWVPGFLGVAAAVLLVVVAANSRTQNKAESPPSQSAALPTKGQTGTSPAPSLPAVPQPSSIKEEATKAPPKAAAVATIGEAAKPAPMHHPMVEAQAVAAPAAAQGS